MFGQSEAQTFLGLPACDDLTTLDARCALFGAPIVTPYESVGPYCRQAPLAIRKAIAPYSSSLHHVDFDLGRPLFPGGEPNAADTGDVPGSETDFAGNREAVRTRAAAILERGAVPILIGGDDSAPIPFFEAYAGRGEFVVLQIDAHIDWRDEVQGERYGLSSNMRRASEMAHIKHIIQVGQRAIGSARPGDYQDARDWGVRFFPAQSIAERGVQPVLEAIPTGAQVLFALDIDGLDPSVVPGVIGRAPGGLSYWQTIALLQGISAKASLAGFNLVEFLPEKDVDGLGALVCARIIANAIGLLAAD